MHCVYSLDVQMKTTAKISEINSTPSICISFWNEQILFIILGIVAKKGTLVWE